MLKTLYLEQRCGLRKTLVNLQKTTKSTGYATPVNVARSILLRVVIFEHLAKEFPEFADEIQKKGSFHFYREYFGKDEDGATVDDWTGPLSRLLDQCDESDCENSGDAVAASSARGDLSTYKSKAPLITFCEKLMGNKYATPLVRLASESHSASRGVVLDLTKKKRHCF